MTNPQRKRFFFPLWNETCRKLGWGMSGGRLIIVEDKLNDHGRRVLAAAEKIAIANHRAPVLDDLRHGCYVVALGRDADTNKLSNKDVDAVTSLFKLLVNDTNIAADMRLNDPTIGARERLVLAINKLRVPDALIISICRRSFAPVYNEPFHEDLPLPNLRALVGILTEMKEKENQLI